MNRQRASLPNLTGPQIVAALTVLAAFCCLFWIGNKSMWLDEGHSISFAKASLPRLWDIVTERQANMGIYYLLLHFWMIPAEGETWIRLLSAVPAIATIPVAYAIAARLWDRRAATISGLLLAINTFLVRYAQEARAYALVMFLVTLSTHLYLRVTDEERRSRSDLLWYVAVSVLAVYAHFYAGLVILAHVLAAGAKDAPRALRSLGGAWLAIGVLVAPLVYFVLFKDTGQIDWIADPTVADLVSALADVTGEGGVLLLLLFAAAWGVAAWSARRAPSERNALLMVAAWLLLPALISFGVSYFKPIFLPRYLIVSVPAAALLAGRGLSLLRDRRLVAAGLAVVVALTSVGLYRYYFEYEKENWKDASGVVLEEGTPEDGIVIYAGRLRKTFEYYVGLHDAEDTAPRPIYPDAEWGTYRSGGVGAPTGLLAGERPERLWLVLSHVNSGNAKRVAQDIHAQILAEYVLYAEHKFTRVKVELYERKTP